MLHIMPSAAHILAIPGDCPPVVLCFMAIAFAARHVQHSHAQRSLCMPSRLIDRFVNRQMTKLSFGPPRRADGTRALIPTKYYVQVTVDVDTVCWRFNDRTREESARKGGDTYKRVD